VQIKSMPKKGGIKDDQSQRVLSKQRRQEI
jgi:hypothetical protein